MFKFLKDKLKGAIEKFSKKVEDEAQSVEEVVEVKEKPTKEIKEVESKEKPKKEKTKPDKKEKIKHKVEEKVEPKVEEIKEISDIPKVEEIKVEHVDKKHSFFGGLFKKKDKEEIKEISDIPKVEEKEHKGLFSSLKEKITTKIIDEKQFDEMFFDLEVVLLENNVAVEVIEKIKIDLKKDITNKPIKRNEIHKEITQSLKHSINSLFEVSPVNLLNNIKKKEQKPYVIVFVGINGSGKTTTIAKVAHFLQKQKLGIVLCAADTFRAAAIQQLEEHGQKLGLKVIKHDYGSDPAAVAFDAISHAKAKGSDVVLIDTAGRLHSNSNLMDEMKKIVRVAKPDFKIFVGESISGNDFIEQAKKFDETIGIDGIILAKADVDEKGGAAISVSYVTGKPILYMGVGQEYENLEEFSAQKIIDRIGI